MAADGAAFQAVFHRRWQHLTDPHVRALAWLLDAPDLLDPQAPQWRGRIASLGPPDAIATHWLATIDAAPDALQRFLAEQPTNRLGRYAERLLAFYFLHRGTLVAHGLQVQSPPNGTVGEFDFLLRDGDALLHWEFASKFYLLESDGAAAAPDRFVGPNLADTLGAKMRKIIDRQLALSTHPAAAAYLPGPVAAAQALVKGWLFYYGRTPRDGHAYPHCRGFWRPVGEIDALDADGFAILSRLQWLAPARIAAADGVLDRTALADALATHFAGDQSPVLVALLAREEGMWLETDRGFIVPNDWRGRAGERIGRMIAG